MKKLKILTAVLAVFITMPIWFYLVYFILTTINAGSLQMFLFWVYVPLAMVVAITSRVMED